MDLSTAVGVIVAWGALIAAMLLDGMSPANLFNVSALVLVVGGTGGATLASFLLSQAKQVTPIMRQTLKPTEDPRKIIESIVEMAAVARKKGLLELDRQRGEVSDPFIRRALTLVIDGTEADVVRQMLEDEFALIEERHRVGERMFTTAAGFAPTLGIIGTVVGLINMLRELSSPDKIGPAIATAFLATLYGVSSANLLFLPIANKLKAQHEQEFVNKRMIIEGALGIAAQDNPSVLRTKLMVYLSPAARRAASQTKETTADPGPAAQDASPSTAPEPAVGARA
ncbi:MAG: motility protein A [bacterium]